MESRCRLANLNAVCTATAEIKKNMEPCNYDHFAVGFKGLGFRVVGFRVEGSGFTVGFRVLGLKAYIPFYNHLVPPESRLSNLSKCNTNYPPLRM